MRVLLMVVALGFAFGSSAEAQRRMTTLSANAGSGLSIGSGQATTVGGQSMVSLRRTPVFVEVEGRTWSTSNPDPVIGAALRVEIDGRTSLAVVPRVQLQRTLSKLEVRVFLGAPFFFAPFSMLGAELGGGISISLGKHFALGVNAMIDAFFWGSDLPDDTVLIGINGMAGLEMRL